MGHLDVLEDVLTHMDVPEVINKKWCSQEVKNLITSEWYCNYYNKNKSRRYNKAWVLSHLYRGRSYPDFGAVWAKRYTDGVQLSSSLEECLGNKDDYDDGFFFKKGDGFTLLSVLGSLMLFRVESVDLHISLIVLDVVNRHFIRIQVPDDLHFEDRRHVNFVSQPNSSCGFQIIYAQFDDMSPKPMLSLFDSVSNQWEMVLCQAISVPQISDLDTTDHRAMIVSRGGGGGLIHFLSFNRDNAPVFHDCPTTPLLVPAFVNVQRPPQRGDWIMRRSMHFSAGNDGLVVLMLRHVHPDFQEYSILDMLVVARIRPDWHHYEFVAELPPDILRLEQPCLYDDDLGLQIQATLDHINIAMVVSTRSVSSHPKPWSIRHLRVDPVTRHWTDSASLSHSSSQHLDLPFFTSNLTLIPSPVRHLTRFGTMFKHTNTIWTVSLVFDSLNHPGYGYIWGMRLGDEDPLRIPLHPIFSNNGVVRLGDKVSLLSVLGRLLLLKVTSVNNEISLMVVDLLGSISRVVKSIKVPDERHHFNYKPHLNFVPHPDDQSPLGFKIVYVHFEDEKDVPMYSIFNSKTSGWELVSAEATLVPNNQNLNTTDHRSMIVSIGGNHVYLSSFNGDNLPVFQRRLMTDLLVPALSKIQLPDPLGTWKMSRTMHFSSGNNGLVVLMLRYAHPTYPEFACLGMLVVARMRGDWQTYEFVAALPPRLLYNEVFIFDEVQGMQVKQTENHINIGMVVYTHRHSWAIRHICYDLVNGQWDDHESLFQSPHEIGLPFFTSKQTIIPDPAIA